MKYTVYYLIVGVVLIPAVLIGWLLWSPTALHWTMDQIQLELPGELQYQSLQGNLLGPVTIRGLDYEDDQQHVQVAEVRFDWNPANLLSGRLYISELELLNPDINIKSAEKNPHTVVLPELELPFDISIERLHIEQAHWQGYGVTQSIQQLDTRIVTVDQRLVFETLELQAEPYQLSAIGQLTPVGDYAMQWSVNWSWLLPEGDHLQGNGQISGDLNRLHITQLLQHPQTVQLDASISEPLNQFNWQASATWQDYDPARWQRSMPPLPGSVSVNAKGDFYQLSASGELAARHIDTGPFKSRFSVAWDGQQLSADRIEITRPDGSASLTLTGIWTAGGEWGQADLKADWTNLQWPLQGETEWVSAEGLAEISGNPDGYQAMLESSRPWRLLPESSWKGYVQGDREGLRFHDLVVQGLEGKILADGTLNWSDSLQWSVQAEVEKINPAAMYAEWPGLLTASLDHKGRLTPEGWDTQTRIIKATGQLRGYPLEMTAETGFSEKGLTIHQLDSRLADSRLQLEGSISTQMQANLDWDIDSPDLKQLHAELDGALTAYGSVVGALEQPTVSASFKGREVQWGDYRVKQLSGQGAVDLAQPYLAEVNFEASDAWIKQLAVKTLQVNGDRRQWTLNAESSDHQLSMQLKGQADASLWQGQLSQLNIDTSAGERWQLLKPVPLKLSERQIQFSRLCLDNDQRSRLCVDVEQQSNQWVSEVTLKNLPARWLQHVLPESVNLQSQVNATANLNYRNGLVLGDGHLKFTPGVIEIPLADEETQRWEFEQAGMAIRLTKDSIEVTGRLRVSDSEQLDARLMLPGARLLSLEEQQPLKGVIKAQWARHEMISLLIPELQSLKGQSRLDMTLDGTLAQPRFIADVQLSDGQLDIPRIGVSVTDIQISAKSSDLNRVKYTLTAKAGEGSMTIDGESRLDNDSWLTELQVKGQRLELARIPEAQIQADVDLRLMVRPYHVTIDGNVHVPYAHIEPRDFTTATRVSSDVVIVDGAPVGYKAWAIESRVRLTLGDRVHFTGYGVEGRLGGSIVIIDDPGLPTRASGEISIADGVYRAYGQKLLIEQGRLIFTGGPISRPGLDIRSIRRVNNVTAGIRVQGNTEQPRIELFSIPAMGQTDVLSYLLLGRPLETASDKEGAMMARAALGLGLYGGDRLARSLRERFGLDEMRVESSDDGNQASLVVGRYLSPKLYVSYGIGLIEAFNTLNVRYQISDQWQLKASSGEAHGADIIYTLER